jgi:hypothetical protein
MKPSLLLLLVHLACLLRLDGGGFYSHLQFTVLTVAVLELPSYLNTIISTLPIYEA